MTTVSMHQSQYLPWPPYFRKIALSDIFVLMDNVQYQNNGVQNRNRIRQKSSDFWITIPVSRGLSDTIEDKLLSDSRWPAKHWNSLKGAYAKAPYWHEYSEELEAIYLGQTYDRLGAINDRLFFFFIERLGIQTKIVRLSELQIEGRKSNLVLETCLKLNADIYLSGTGSLNYLDEGSFTQNNVSVRYLRSNPPSYTQFHGTFLSGLSMIDMMMNVSKDEIHSYLYHTS
ncbi:WbqC-like protein [Paenibacillus taihuensis]|uniref:WbqC-like protein n=1 Tax=Paenibacillus taihuensis TaxID=1156355 RepID=A0A3D9RXF7_9BACL|nr:WbqC family protein [Paenibacillus taihuensis]REE84507.1 WbqC-like protein [Paenibacillus taihuensis]